MESENRETKVDREEERGGVQVREILLRRGHESHIAEAEVLCMNGLSSPGDPPP